jgi:glycosyltransferase involved in cell wall biosynthesis
LKISVVIPTFKPQRRIIPTLLAIADALVLPMEVLVVNNSPETKFHPEAIKHLEDLNLKTNIRILEEFSTGLTKARSCGVREASGDIVVFIDDDVVVDRAFFKNGKEAFEKSGGNLGLLISRVYPSYFEGPPDPSVLKREHLLALNYRLGDNQIDFGSGNSIAPTIGAALWVLKSAADKIFYENKQVLSDRVGTCLSSGGDIEIGLLVGKMGLRRIYDPSVQAIHRIPKSRFEIAYFCKLISGIAKAEIHLRGITGTLSNKAKLKLFTRAIGSFLLSPLLFFTDFSIRELAFRYQNAFSIIQGLVEKIEDSSSR